MSTGNDIRQQRYSRFRKHNAKSEFAHEFQQSNSIN